MPNRENVKSTKGNIPKKTWNKIFIINIEPNELELDNHE